MGLESGIDPSPVPSRKGRADVSLKSPSPCGRG
jgi:hypothetical protein